MRKIERLKKEAMESCKFRGHKMSRFITVIENERAYAVCKVCHKVVCVDAKPVANDIDMGGEAVAIECWG